MKVLVTGADGFVGKNVIVALRRLEGVEIVPVTRATPLEELPQLLSDADFVYHLAGVNRPKDASEFETGNAGFTREICNHLSELNRKPKIVFSSSIQAEGPSVYGVSKADAETALREFAASSGAEVSIYRLRNVFGKWSRPNYNSVVATFCHNISHDLPITISNPDQALELVYIDDIVEAFIEELKPESGSGMKVIERFTPVTLGELAALIQSFKDIRTSRNLPDFDRRFVAELYTTYLSYLPTQELQYDLVPSVDPRGLLAEFLRFKGGGQIFISRTKPGITRGNHFHNTKTEKFLVLEGQAVIKMRNVLQDEVHEFFVSGDAPSVVDIAPGCTHSITNTGAGELVTLFWASEPFDPARPDTYFEGV